MAARRSTRASAAAANAAGASASESESATSASDAPRRQRRKSVRVAGAASSTNDGRKARKQQRSSPIVVQQQHAADESSADESGPDLVITASQLVLSPGSQSQSQSQYGRSARRPAVVGKAIKSASSRLNRITERNNSESASASENGDAPPSVSTTEDEGEDSDDDEEGDTTIYANGEDAPTVREGSESNSDGSPNPEVENNNVEEAVPLFSGQDNITTAPSLDELAEDAQGVLEVLLQKKTLSLDRNEKNILFRLRKSERLVT